MDGNLEKMMAKHIEESPAREKKLGEIEESNKNIARSLATGDGKFKELDTKIDEIHHNVISLTHTIHGNGRPGVWEQFELQGRILKELTDEHKDHSESIKVINEHANILRKHENFFQRAIGVMTLFKFVGVGSLGYLAVLVVKAIVEMIK